jgi:hypothetical protein
VRVAVSDRDDRELSAWREKIWKVPARWSALYSASHWHSSWEPRLVVVLRAKASKKNQTIKRSGAESNNESTSHKYHYPIPLVFRIKAVKIPGESR